MNWNERPSSSDDLRRGSFTSSTFLSNSMSGNGRVGGRSGKVVVGSQTTYHGRMGSRVFGRHWGRDPVPRRTGRGSDMYT